MDNVYTFNGDGKRVQIVDSTGTKRPIWDFENVLLETNSSNTTQVIYTLEPMTYGNLVSQRRSGTTTIYLFDALGSTRKIIDNPGASAAVIDSYDYKAYGETYASSGSTTNVFRWVGQLGYYYDVDRLAYYLRARPYDPKLTRFLSEDPIGFIGSRWNLFLYVGGGLLNQVDPSGLQVDCKIAYTTLEPERVYLVGGIGLPGASSEVPTMPLDFLVCEVVENIEMECVCQCNGKVIRGPRGGGELRRFFLVQVTYLLLMGGQPTPFDQLNFVQDVIDFFRDKGPKMSFTPFVAEWTTAESKCKSVWEADKRANRERPTVPMIEDRGFSKKCNDFKDQLS